jgi:hypothetical protein
MALRVVRASKRALAGVVAVQVEDTVIARTVQSVRDLPNGLLAICIDGVVLARPSVVHAPRGIVRKSERLLLTDVR